MRLISAAFALLLLAIVGASAQPFPANPIFSGMTLYGLTGCLQANGMAPVTTVPCSSSAAVTVGATPVLGGVSGRFLWDNGGILFEQTTTGSGNVVLATSPTIASPTLVTAALGTPASGILTNMTGLPLTTGVSGQLPVANGGTGVATFSANLPLLGNGTGPVAQGTVAGNTSKFGTVNGALVNGDCVSIDSNFNFVDAGGPCTTGGGGGTVLSGAANQIGYYATSSSTIAGLTTANNAVLVTNGSGAPSESTTLPTGLALQTPASATLTNATGLPIGTGVSGLGSGIAAALGLSLNGTGAVSATTSPIFVTPTLGTPASGVATNLTGLPVSTGLTGAGTGVITGLGAAVGATNGFAGVSTANAFTATQSFAEVLGSVTSQSGTTYTFSNADCGTEVNFTNAGAITATIPATMPVGCNISILQGAAGKVSVNGSAVAPATLHSAHSYTGTSGQWAMVGVTIEANSGGSSAIAILTGDGS